MLQKFEKYIKANYLEDQAGIKITGINGQMISASAATEAFDEPLTKA